MSEQENESQQIETVYDQAAETAPAGWHPDPNISGQLRYWDGQDWTSHTHQEIPADVELATWRFSFFGLFWAVVAIGGVIGSVSEGEPMMVLVGLAAAAYSVYLFRGGRFGFIIF